MYNSALGFRLKDNNMKRIASISCMVTLIFSIGVIGQKRNSTHPDFVYEDFSEELAGAYANGNWGFVNKAGKFAIQPTFDKVIAFCEGLAPVESGEKWGYIRPLAKVINRG